MKHGVQQLVEMAWVTTIKARPQARLRLFCLSYAGGSAATYFSWSEHLPDSIEVCPIQLPGRGPRLREQAFSALPPLISDLAPALYPYLDRPFALFGHSMGSFVAFELAQEIRRLYGLEPVVLCVSGRRPVHLSEPYTHIRHLPDSEFLQALHRRYGMLEHVLRNPDLSTVFLPILRADFSICETYQPSTEQPFSCPLIAYAGLSDRDVHAHELAQWRRYTSNVFTMNVLPGNHFFIETHQDAFMRKLRADLSVFSQVPASVPSG